MIHVALVEPEIPPNTGNIARLCAANEITLHIVGMPGFRMDEKAVRRAGLDYWEHVRIEKHIEIEDLFSSLPDSRFFFLSTKASRVYSDVSFRKGDCFVFGRETRGLPEELLAKNPKHSLTIPMSSEKVRSLNLATSVGIVVYEALRQIRTTQGEV